MTRKPTTEDGDGKTASQSTPRTSPRGFGALGRKIANRSGNLLATAVIVILGLTFGREVIQWWRQPASGVHPSADRRSVDVLPLLDPTVPHLLEFGDVPITLGRVVFQGNREEALAELRRRCRRLTIDAPNVSRGAGEAEARLLRRLDAGKPVEAGDGWRIYQYAGPILMVVGVRAGQVSTNGKPRGSGSTNTQSVVSWGLGLRHFDSTEGGASRRDRWTLFTSRTDGRPTNSGSKPPVPLPPGSRRTLSVRVADGGILVGFAGRGSVGDWQHFFDRSFQQNGWRPAEPWSRLGSGRHARYRRDSAACDVQLIEEAGNLLRGILTVTPATERLEK